MLEPLKLPDVKTKFRTLTGILLCWVRAGEQARGDAALSLYLHIVNLFQLLLSLFGQREE